MFGFFSKWEANHQYLAKVYDISGDVYHELRVAGFGNRAGYQPTLVRIDWDVLGEGAPDFVQRGDFNQSTVAYTGNENIGGVEQLENAYSNALNTDIFYGTNSSGQTSNLVGLTTATFERHTDLCV